MTLRRAILLLVAGVLLVGLVPAGVLLDRRIGTALLERARAELANAPRIFEDRMAAMKDVRMMHAKDFSAMPALTEAFRRDALEEARRSLESAAVSVQEAPVLIDGDGRPRTGPAPVPEDLVAATRRGEMPVALVQVDSVLHLMALAPVMDRGQWLGAVGGTTAFGEEDAATLAGLTRSGVVVLGRDGEVAAGTLAPGTARALAREALGGDGTLSEVELEEGRYLVTSASVDDGTVLFARDLGRELGLLPELRGTALATTGAVLALALLIGALFARRLASPVSQLADAAEAFEAGRSTGAAPPSSIVEVERLAGSFESMRASLAHRLAELQEANSALEAANRTLEERQDRLTAVQAELVQRERMASAGRLLTQLAHEIRNPIASVRNCLEVVRRRGGLEPEVAGFADMAVDELLRMHELSERMLDLHRPRGREAVSEVSRVIRETVELVRVGAGDGGVAVRFVGGDSSLTSGSAADPALDPMRAAMAPDDLKQVLLNLLLNAVDAAPDGSVVEIDASTRDGQVRIEVVDRGSGLPDEVAGRIFDPFFTTKADVHGVGLGLYIAQGLVRAAGGTLTATNRDPGPGARFVVELTEAVPVAEVAE